MTNFITIYVNNNVDLFYIRIFKVLISLGIVLIEIDFKLTTQKFQMNQL